MIFSIPESMTGIRIDQGGVKLLPKRWGKFGESINNRCNLSRLDDLEYCHLLYNIRIQDGSSLIQLMGQTIFLDPVAQFVGRHVHQACSFGYITTGGFHGFSDKAFGRFLVIQSIFRRFRG